MKQYKSVSLLVLDEWLLVPLKGSEARDLLEIIEANTEPCTGTASLEAGRLTEITRQVS